MQSLDISGLLGIAIRFQSSLAALRFSFDVPFKDLCPYEGNMIRRIRRRASAQLCNELEWQCRGFFVDDGILMLLLYPFVFLV